MIVVSDATLLMALAKIGRLALLQDLFGAIWVPDAVYAEVTFRVPNRPGADEVCQASWISVMSVVDSVKADYLRLDLDRGEAEVLVLAAEMAADWVLLDEVKARLAADLLGLQYIGAVGLLLPCQAAWQGPGVASSPRRTQRETVSLERSGGSSRSFPCRRIVIRIVFSARRRGTDFLPSADGSSPHPRLPRAAWAGTSR